MNPKAEQYLHDKISGLIQSFLPGSHMMFSESFNGDVKLLAKEIVKQRGKWIDEESATRMIFRYIYNEISSYEDSEGIEVYGELVDVKKFADGLVGDIKSIPNCYDVYFDFDVLMRDRDYQFRLGGDKGYEFGRFWSDEVRGPEGSVLGGIADPQEITCLKIPIKGYCDSNESCLTLHDARSYFKIFVCLAIDSGLFSVSQWSAPKKYNRYLTYPAMHVCEVGVAGRDSYALSRDINLLLHKLTIVKGADESFVTPRIEELSRGFEALIGAESTAAKKLRMACEWSFDALVEESAPMAVVKICIALESIYGDSNSEAGVTKTLTDRCAYFLANSHANRVEISNSVKDLYQLRSKIVHGVESRLNAQGRELLELGRHLLRQSINKELVLLRAATD